MTGVIQMTLCVSRRCILDDPWVVGHLVEREAVGGDQLEKLERSGWSSGMTYTEDKVLGQL